MGREWRLCIVKLSETVLTVALAVVALVLVYVFLREVLGV
jgi:hypothetical protein